MAGLAEQVKEFRERHSLTQSELAQRLEVDAQTISNLESGRTKSLKLSKLRRLKMIMAEMDAGGRPAPFNVTEVQIGGDATATLSNDLLDFAQRAAARRGMTLSAWLAELIQRATREDGTDTPRETPPTPKPKPRK